MRVHGCMRAHIPAIIIDQATGSHPHPWCRALPDTTFSRQVLNYLGMHPQVRLYNYQDLTALRRPIGRPSPAPASSSGVPGREFGEGQRAVLWIEERPRLREWREQRGRAAAGRVRFAERQRYIERLAGRWALAVEGVDQAVAGQAGKTQGPAEEAVTHRKQPNSAKLSERPEGRTDKQRGRLVSRLCALCLIKLTWIWLQLKTFSSDTTFMHAWRNGAPHFCCMRKNSCELGQPDPDAMEPQLLDGHAGFQSERTWGVEPKIPSYSAITFIKRINRGKSGVLLPPSTP